MLYPVVTKKILRELYEEQNLSMMQIANQLGCSVHKVTYWMSAYDIKRRKISEAIYIMHNPNGDPFKIKAPETADELILFGLGIGLYWGEGTKSNKNAVRLGNTDPGIIRCFVKFLTELCGVNINSLKFGLQIFSDIKPEIALGYWLDALKVDKSQFYKPVVTKSGSIGTYRNKNQYGVVTIQFGNTKLRNIIVEQVAEIAQMAERFNGNEKVTGSIPVLGSIDQKNIIIT